MVWHLATAAVDDSCDLVGDHKFQILCCELIANEKTIFYLDSSQNLIAESRPPACHMRAVGSERDAQPPGGLQPAADGCNG